MFRLFPFFTWRSRQSWLYGLISVVSALIICLTTATPSYGVSWIELILRGAQIIQLSSVSDQQEVELGKQINQELISSGQAKILRNQSITNYVNQIGQRLAKKSDRPNISYTFQVVDDKNINAFATMGGFVYINTGLMLAAKNEAELASVIGHEIGHIVGRHSIEQMRQRAIAQGLLSATGIDQSQAIQIGVELAVSRPNSREDELEADQFGLENIRKAGYAPIGMVAFMQTLLEKGGGGSTPTFLSTHPATSDRIKALEQKIDSNARSGEGLNEQAYRNQIRSLL